MYLTDNFMTIKVKNDEKCNVCFVMRNMTMAMVKQKAADHPDQPPVNK